MQNLTSLIVVLICGAFFTLHGQNLNIPPEQKTRACLTDEYNEWVRSTFSNVTTNKKHKEEIQFFVQKSSNLKTTSGPNEIIRIPVIVHVIHSGEPIGTGPNISEAQILSQIKVLNEDFRRAANSRGYNTDPVGADTEIEFYLAKEDPFCNPTTGIERLNMSSVSSSWSAAGGNTDTVLKPETIWDPSRYLNIWTVKFTNSTNLGFSQYPGGNPDTDGVVINYLNFGSDDDPDVSLEAPYHLGRTATHEVGHFFGLYHTWEGKNCAGSGDGVDDTPPQSKETLGCPSPIPDSCPDDSEDDMIENYLDYTDDECMNLFTQGQKTVMRGYLQDPNYRLSLTNSTVSETPLQIYSYDASIIIEAINEDACINSLNPRVLLSNYGSQTITSASINYGINGNGGSVYQWTGNLAQNQSTFVDLPAITSPAGNNVLDVAISLINSDPRACNNQASKAFTTTETYPSAGNINLTLKTDSWAEETSWEFKDEAGNILYSEGPYKATADDNKIFNYTFNVVADQCYTFIILDDSGDGICCTHGNGYYELKTSDGTLIFSGGEYKSAETTTISTKTLSTPEYFEKSEVKLYPNPARNNMFISIKNSDLPDSYEIFDMIGQRIFTSKITSTNNLNIDLSNFSTGLYFLKLTKGTASQVLKFVKR